MAEYKVRFPGNSDRLVNIGRTGTGKTVAGLYHLSRFDLRDPWVILNFKNDEHIESIEKARFVELGYVPKKKDEGLFVQRVFPADRKGTAKEPSRLSKLFEGIWARGNCGIFADELFMVGSDDNFDMILTQGRSLRVPVIGNTQKPSWISTFNWSEATFIQCFDLNDNNDIRRVEEFMPIDWDEEPPLEEFESYYYDIPKDEIVRFRPVPDMDEIRNRFDMKLRTPRVLI